MRKFLKSIFKLCFPKARILYPASDYTVLLNKRLTFSDDLLWTYHNADFLKDPKFEGAYKWCKKVDNGRLLVDYDIQWRIYVLCWAATQASKLDGDFVDCGVYTGMCPRAVIDYVGFEKLGKKYFLFDTFQGMDPKYSSEYEMGRNKQQGYADKGDLYDEVKKTFSDFNVEIVKGPIPETLENFNGDKVSYLSIDMNSVIPEIEALEFFWDKLVPGGIIVLDDYGYPGSEEQKVAHDKFASSKNTMVLSLPTCQGIIIKN